MHRYYLLTVLCVLLSGPAYSEWGYRPLAKGGSVFSTKAEPVQGLPGTMALVVAEGITLPVVYVRNQDRNFDCGSGCTVTALFDSGKPMRLKGEIVDGALFLSSADLLISTLVQAQRLQLQVPIKGKGSIELHFQVSGLPKKASTPTWMSEVAGVQWGSAPNNHKDLQKDTSEDNPKGLDVYVRKGDLALPGFRATEIKYFFYDGRMASALIKLDKNQRQTVLATLASRLGAADYEKNGFYSWKSSRNTRLITADLALMPEQPFDTLLITYAPIDALIPVSARLTANTP